MSRLAKLNSTQIYEKWQIDLEIYIVKLKYSDTNFIL